MSDSAPEILEAKTGVSDNRAVDEKNEILHYRKDRFGNKITKKNGNHQISFKD